MQRVYWVRVKYNLHFYYIMELARWLALAIALFCCDVELFAWLPCLPSG
jgi:hypothetical protein